jgi:putative ATP-dependent endonuclease of the OLD family
VVKVTRVLCALKGEVMYIESLVLQNFRCFGNQRTVIPLGPELTPFIGSNGAGKTAACQALQRLFGITSDERAVRVDDFHVPAGEPPPEGRRGRRSRGL